MLGFAIPEQSDNHPRYAQNSNHVESWFLRANHPTKPRALWLKATILGRRGGRTIAEIWCSLFDSEENKAQGAKTTVDLDEAQIAGEPLRIELAGSHFQFGPSKGEAKGSAGIFSWDLKWERVRSPLGDALCMLPTRKLIDAAIPKNKLLTPSPVLRFSGSVHWDGEEWEVENWLGMQGHNWGPAHSPEYAWGQCIFTDSEGEPFCVVEGASGRIKIGPLTSPILGLMTIRRGNRTYRFDRLVDLWNQNANIQFPDWTLRMQGADGEAFLSMRASPANMVCLGYENPNGQLSHCLNSKLATVSLRVNPINEDAFECRSNHGGALEFLQSEPVPQLPEVI